MCHRYKDAVFLSPHKFVGGTGTPGKPMLNIRLLTCSYATKHLFLSCFLFFVFAFCFCFCFLFYQVCLLLRKVCLRTQSLAVLEAVQCYL